MPLYKKLLILPLLLLVTYAMYGFVNLLDMLKNFEDESWIAPLFVLLLLAVIPIVIFMMANKGMEAMEKQNREEEKKAADEDSSYQ